MPTIRKKIIVAFLIIMIGLSVYKFNSLSPIERPPFFKFDHDGPLVIAHRGGAEIAPENTIYAIDNAVNLGVDLIEIDIHMSKDGHLVLMHDASVNRTTDGTGYIHDMTLQEIQSLDAGYHYTDKNGEYYFRGKGIYVPTLEEVFKKHPNMKFIIEVKHTTPRKFHHKITSELWKLIEMHGMENQVLVSSFNQNIIHSFNEHAKDKVALGIGRNEAIRFVVAQKLKLQHLYRPTGHVISLPEKRRNLNLFEESFILAANNLGLDIHYWTVNKEETMKEMIKAGVDGIITDQPDVLIDILRQKGYR